MGDTGTGDKLPQVDKPGRTRLDARPPQASKRLFKMEPGMSATWTSGLQDAISALEPSAQPGHHARKTVWTPESKIRSNNIKKHASMSTPMSPFPSAYGLTGYQASRWLVSREAQLNALPPSMHLTAPPAPYNTHMPGSKVKPGPHNLAALAVVACHHTAAGALSGTSGSGAGGGGAGGNATGGNGTGRIRAGGSGTGGRGMGTGGAASPGRAPKSAVIPLSPQHYRMAAPGGTNRSDPVLKELSRSTLLTPTSHVSSHVMVGALVSHPTTIPAAPIPPRSPPRNGPHKPALTLSHPANHPPPPSPPRKSLSVFSLQSAQPENTRSAHATGSPSLSRSHTMTGGPRHSGQNTDLGLHLHVQSITASLQPEPSNASLRGGDPTTLLTRTYQQHNSQHQSQQQQQQQQHQSSQEHQSQQQQQQQQHQSSQEHQSQQQQQQQQHPSTHTAHIPSPTVSRHPAFMTPAPAARPFPAAHNPVMRTRKSGAASGVGDVMQRVLAAEPSLAAAVLQANDRVAAADVALATGALGEPHPAGSLLSSLISNHLPTIHPGMGLTSHMAARRAHQHQYQQQQQPPQHHHHQPQSQQQWQQQQQPHREHSMGRSTATLMHHSHAHQMQQAAATSSTQSEQGHWWWPAHASTQPVSNSTLPIHLPMPPTAAMLPLSHPLNSQKPTFFTQLPVAMPAPVPDPSHTNTPQHMSTDARQPGHTGPSPTEQSSHASPSPTLGLAIGTQRPSAHQMLRGYGAEAGMRDAAREALGRELGQLVDVLQADMAVRVDEADLTLKTRHTHHKAGPLPHFHAPGLLVAITPTTPPLAKPSTLDVLGSLSSPAIAQQQPSVASPGTPLRTPMFERRTSVPVPSTLVASGSAAAEATEAAQARPTTPQVVTMAGGASATPLSVQGRATPPPAPPALPSTTLSAADDLQTRLPPHIAVDIQAADDAATQRLQEAQATAAAAAAAAQAAAAVVAATAQAAARPPTRQGLAEAVAAAGAALVNAAAQLLTPKGMPVSEAEGSVPVPVPAPTPTGPAPVFASASTPVTTKPIAQLSRSNDGQETCSTSHVQPTSLTLPATTVEAAIGLSAVAAEGQPQLAATALMAVPAPAQAGIVAAAPSVTADLAAPAAIGQAPRFASLVQRPSAVIDYMIEEIVGDLPERPAWSGWQAQYIESANPSPAPSRRANDANAQSTSSQPNDQTSGADSSKLDQPLAASTNSHSETASPASATVTMDGARSLQASFSEGEHGKLDSANGSTNERLDENTSVTAVNSPTVIDLAGDVRDNAADMTTVSGKDDPTLEPNTTQRATTESVCEARSVLPHPHSAPAQTGWDRSSYGGLDDDTSSHVQQYTGHVGYADQMRHVYHPGEESPGSVAQQAQAIIKSRNLNDTGSPLAGVYKRSSAGAASGPSSYYPDDDEDLDLDDAYSSQGGYGDGSGEGGRHGSRSGQGTYDGVEDEGAEEVEEQGDGYADDMANSEDGEMLSVSAYGITPVQPLHHSSRKHGASSARAYSPNDVVEGGMRLLGQKYEVLDVVGEGAYGMVMKCRVRGSDPEQWVAVKEFKITDDDPDAEDVKRTSRREVSLLRVLQHPHVVACLDDFLVRDRLFIVMELVPCNLLELLEAQPGGMDREAVRLILYQLCTAIAFIHSKGVIYRDIKPENLLVDEQGRLKLCDFGFARFLERGKNERLTDYVATRWYRAPELLLGPPFQDKSDVMVQCMYGPPVDMWAIGCLMGELMDGEPLFPGDSDLDQLYRIQAMMGAVTAAQQELFNRNPINAGIAFNIREPLTLATRYEGTMNEVELDFMGGLLSMDPEKRLTGEACLCHPYLRDLWEADRAKGEYTGASILQQVAAGPADAPHSQGDRSESAIEETYAQEEMDLVEQTIHSGDEGRGEDVQTDPGTT